MMVETVSAITCDTGIAAYDIRKKNESNGKLV